MPGRECTVMLAKEEESITGSANEGFKNDKTVPCRSEKVPHLRTRCAGCNQGCHSYCADPPIENISAIGDWYCSACAPTLAPTIQRGRRSQSTRPSTSQVLIQNGLHEYKYCVRFATSALKRSGRVVGCL